MAQKKKEPAQKKSRNRKRTIKADKGKVASACSSRKTSIYSRNMLDGSFPIAGIGASAGGLEAIEQFFRHMPPDAGIAFILIPHLDPSHASMMTDLIRRFTKMAVVEAGDGMQVEPDHVYVIPPNRNMAIFHKTLHLSVPDRSSRSQNAHRFLLPISGGGSG